MPTLPVIAPVLDEGDRLAAVVEPLLAAPWPIERDWIFGDDGSVDGSGTILEGLDASDRPRVIRHPSTRASAPQSATASRPPAATS